MTFFTITVKNKNKKQKTHKTTTTKPSVLCMMCCAASNSKAWVFFPEEQGHSLAPTLSYGHWCKCQSLLTFTTFSHEAQKLTAFLCPQEWMGSHTQEFSSKKWEAGKTPLGLKSKPETQRHTVRTQGCLLFMRTAWPHHEWVMRVPLSPRDQAQSPGIAMKYSIVFTHCNLIPQKRTAKPGFCVPQLSFPLSGWAVPWPDLTIQEAPNEQEEKERPIKSLLRQPQ